MKRVIIDYQKLNADILELLIEKYPDGYQYKDIITFQNSEGKTISAVEVRTEDVFYLVKISTKLEQAMEDYTSDENLQDYDEDNYSDDDEYIDELD